MRFETLLAHPAAQALGRALLHFLWQGSLLGLLLWMVKTIAPTSARVRYASASLIMFMMPVALMVTISRDLRQEQPVVGIAPVASSHARVTGETSREALIGGLPTSGPSAGISGWVVCIWIAGVFLLSLRAAGGWMRAQRLKRRVLAASGELQDMMTRLKRRLGVSTPVRLYTSAIVQVPTVIGWVRPYVLLPVTTITGLSESQLRAILAHELAHIRRYDYLVNLLQTAVETVLFYHPAVWWVGRQMRIEREHCCDDVAVAVSGNPFEYAEALAELEEMRGRIPQHIEPALAATGGELLGRIRRLLGQPPSEDSASRSLGTIAAAAALVLFIAGAPVVAQQPAFEVASIKPNVSGDPSRGARNTAGRLTITNMTLKDLVKFAYDVEDFRISGGPGWITADHYDIAAKAEGKPRPDQNRLMLQTLLKDRFKLALHRETKDLPIYALTVAKSGLKLRPASCITLDPSNPTLAPGQKASDSCGYRMAGRGTLDATKAGMADLAKMFSTLLGRTVLDKTEVTGEFAVHLTFTADDSVATPFQGAGDSDGPNIFTAVQEQLGLKLESTKGPVDVLVIDRVEKPSEN
jgi:uncharacterized protein (TIGR03435 family)